MTRERIEDIREIVLPFVRNVLLKTNYENLGESDTEEFTRDFNEILDLAVKGLEPTPKEKGEMTKEKAIEILKADSIVSYSVEDILSARDMAIKALEQEPILDKIRAEIEELPEEMGNILNLKTGEVIGKYISSVKVLQIINKYKAESED